MERGTYGTYSVTVYVKDMAGNKSRKLKVKINFVNPNPGTDQRISRNRTLRACNGQCNYRTVIS